MNVAAMGTVAATAAAGLASTALADEPPAEGEGAPEGMPGMGAASEPLGEPVNSATDWLGEAPVVDDADIASEVDCEFLVIGMGNAGLFAARKAAELGTKVVVMEKMAEDMWSPIGCDMGVINGDYYLEMGCEYIDPTEYMNEWQRRHLDYANPYYTKQFATRGGEMASWVRAVVPQEELDEYSNYYSYPNGRINTVMEISGKKSFPGTVSYRDWNNILGNGENQPALKHIYSYSIQALKDNGGEILYGTSAVVLVQNADGDVLGAIGQDQDGNYVKVNAANTLVACGDYGANGLMVLALSDEIRELAEACGLDTSDPSGFRGMGQDGYGHKLLCWAGGYMEPGLRAAQNYTNGMGVPELPVGGNYPVFGGDGKRFFNEGISMFGGIGFMLRRPAGELVSVITDSKCFDDVIYQSYEHCVPSTTCEHERNLVREDLDNYVTGPEGFEVHGFTGYGMGTSTMYAAETLDELADILGYEGEAKENLLAEIEHYNEMCAAGHDDDWGRDPLIMRPIDTPPFFGKSSVTAKGMVRPGLVQHGGVVANDFQQVLRKDDTVIKGLSATGNCLGGRYAVKYQTTQAGCSVGIAATLGMCVGEYVALNG